MRKIFLLLLTLAILALALAGCAGQSASDAVQVQADSELPGTPHAVTGYIVVRGFEWGPGVNKVIVELDEAVDSVATDADIAVVTSHYDREVTAAYLSDSLGNAVKASSNYIALELETSFDCTGSPFEVNLDTELNEWADDYYVTVSMTVMRSNTYFTVDLYADCIENRLCPELDRFTVQDSFTGDYVNPLTHETETLTLNYAAYEPDSLDSWEQNPLIIWLHALGEGGTDIEKAILGNEVSALTESDIQSHFTSGEQVGAYVLVVQAPTYWMDAGDNTYHKGDMPSRYSEILMDTINAYLESNPDVDPDRIYLGGASNGGYMTIEMITNYPEYFAAGFPCSAAYSYYVYAKDYTGAYRTYNTFFGVQYLKSRVLYLTDDKLRALCETPLWFVQSATDTLVPAMDYSIPVYQALLQAGADNCWYSLYFDVVGTESSGTQYLGHWAWIYLLNDEVSYVQDTSAIAADNASSSFFYGLQPNSVGGTERVTGDDGVYAGMFDWMNDQVRD